MIGRLALATVAAWLVVAAIVLGRFADAVLPASYLIRPLVVAAVLALAIGGGQLIAGRHAVALATGIAVLIVLPDPVIALAMAGVLIGVELLRRRGRMPGDTQRPVLLLVGVFFGLGLVRAISVIDLPTDAGYRADSGGPPMYVVLLDGYPRIDSLDALGIDNQPFVDALESRGFDHYPDAHSLHTKTHKTLLALLTDESVNDEPVTVAERRAIRKRLVVPPGFIAIDPPIGFVTLGPGPHVDPGGVNDFEAQLVGQSAVAVLASDWAWSWLLDGFRDRVDGALSLLETRPERRIFVHLAAPHPPFLYGADGSADAPRWCWPQCGLFVNTVEGLGVSPDQWAGGMAAQLHGLNARLVETLDALIARHPDAVIVLFSDHGGRVSTADPDEWHRSFLAARTPGHPGLFAAAPSPDTIIRTLLSTYAEP